ncbi:hypothetical protein [Enterococcus thailandicus]|uniref:hypothetical protein n=1 Tax=Enterococcus thailandicus TaxID=417368 RepID=UPI0035E1460D
MIKGKSKFDSQIVYGDWRNWGVFNKQKYTREQAIERWKKEMFGLDETVSFVVEDAFARYRVGQTEDHEPCAGWWCEWEDYGSKSVPAWSIRQAEPWEETE